jgi:hypothetical protein
MIVLYVNERQTCSTELLRLISLDKETTFIPKHLTLTSETERTQPLISGGLGCLTVLVVPIVLIFMAVTICLLPLAFLGALLMIIAWAFGLVAAGLSLF